VTNGGGHADAPHDGWARWSVVLLKPDALERGLTSPILAAVEAEAAIVAVRSTTVTVDQVLAHYADLLGLSFGFDVEQELCRTYVGRRVAVALTHGYDDTTAARLRALLGHYDPDRAGRSTIRGRYGNDTAVRARAERRFVRNLIHTSDDPAGTEREFRIWFGPARTHLLHRRPVET
jgi:nucleoside-diphosphate kinase